MKVKFIADEENKVTTKLFYDEKEFEFKYIDFIIKLYEGKELEECEFGGEIDDNVKTSLSSMVSEINDIVLSYMAKRRDAE